MASRLWLFDSDLCPWAAPNPGLTDTDGDGVNDPQERDGAGRNYAGTPIDLRANPLERDTDGDLYADCLAAGEPCADLEPDPAPLHSSILRVDDQCTGDDCWENTVPSLATALDTARTAGQNPDPRQQIRSIWVAGGTYMPAVGQSFDLPEGVRVFGGFRGDEQRLDERSASTSGPDATVLQPAGVPTGPVVTIDEDDVTLDGVVIQGGQGGVRGTGDRATLRNVRISNNTQPPADESGPGPVPTGGGITWIGGDDLAVEGSTISTNTGPVGGVYLNGSTDVRFASSTIRNNSSTRMKQTGSNANGAGGGGVALDDATVTFDRSRIEDNAALAGAGIDVAGAASVLRLLNSEVTGNTATGNATVVGRGGGVHAYRSARVLMTNCLLSGNRTRVGPRWSAAEDDGFGGGLFAYKVPRAADQSARSAGTTAPASSWSRTMAASSAPRRGCRTPSSWATRWTGRPPTRRGSLACWVRRVILRASRRCVTWPTV